MRTEPAWYCVSVGTDSGNAPVKQIQRDRTARSLSDLQDIEDVNI